MDKFDVIVIGSGIAGLTTALNAAKKNLNIAIVSKNYITSSTSTQALGGINSILNEKDSIETFINDIIKSSKSKYDLKTVEYFTKNTNNAINFLIDIGVKFEKENNSFKFRKLGGSSVNRALFASDFTGLKIVQTLFDNIIVNKNITIFEDFFLLDLIVKDNEAVGVVLLDLKENKTINLYSSNIVLATGGYSSIYFRHSTNSEFNSGDGIAVAIKNNVNLADIELIQFHPTVLKDKFFLISEASRSLGAKIVLANGERFVDELQTRDVVSKAIKKQILKGNEVYLDFKDIEKEKIILNLNQEYKLFKNLFDLDLTKDLIPIIPAAHYSMGGIEVDLDLKTNLANLYAVGEVANTKLHGINRLAGNSLLEAVVFGIKLGSSLEKKEIKTIKKEFNLKKYIKKSKINFYKVRDKFGKIMYQKAGLISNKKSLLEAKEFLDSIDFNEFGVEDYKFNTALKELIEFENLVTIAKIVVTKRIESEN